MPDRSTLMRMATGYLARYAASSHRVRAVLERRIRRRCLQDGLDPPERGALEPALDAVVAHLRQLGLLDDTAFAASRTRLLERKGLPERRVRLMLRGEGLESLAPEDRDEPIDDAAQARRYAARKRLGPFRARERQAFRDKDLRSLLRAGFSFGVAAAAVDADIDQDPV